MQQMKKEMDDEEGNKHLQEEDKGVADAFVG